MTDAATTGPATTTLRRVRLADLDAAQRRSLTERATTATPEIRERARRIVEAVRDGGDAALREAGATGILVVPVEKLLP
jgi:hypothetical protein